MLLIQNAHIKTMAGADIPNGCLLIEDGKIAAVAPEIDAPVGAKVIDAQGRLLTPGCAPPFATSANCPAPFRPWAFPA